jgi:Tfp pilus assembly protein PilX
MSRRFPLSSRPAALRLTPPAAQQGVVLVIALILLAVIGLSSAAALRGGLFGDRVSNNMRLATVALQSAEQALKACENDVRSNAAVWGEALPALNPRVPIQPIAQNPTAWTVRANWTGAAPLAYRLPAAAMTSATSNVNYGANGAVTLPQCLVEEMTLNRRRNASTRVRAFLITVRGFSPDYQVNANGVATSGTEVWLQSQIYR